MKLIFIMTWAIANCSAHHKEFGPKFEFDTTCQGWMVYTSSKSLIDDYHDLTEHEKRTSRIYQLGDRVEVTDQVVIADGKNK